MKREEKRKLQNSIHLGTHGENYGSWISNMMFYNFGGMTFLAFALAFVFFKITKITWIGIVLSIVAVGLLLYVLYISWVKKQYAYNGGQIMDHVHKSIVTYLDFDGQGKLLDVGCGSGALAIRCALTWPEAKIIGVDYWSAGYDYSKDMCEENAELEGVGRNCAFMKEDANHLAFPDESVDAVVSNYVYSNIPGADGQQLIRESLRVLKKGGVFAINDSMKQKAFGDIEELARELRNEGYKDVQVINTSQAILGSEKNASMLFLKDSKMLVGVK